MPSNKPFKRKQKAHSLNKSMKKFLLPITLYLTTQKRDIISVTTGCLLSWSCHWITPTVVNVAFSFVLLYVHMPAVKLAIIFYLRPLCSVLNALSFVIKEVIALQLNVLQILLLFHFLHLWKWPYTTTMFWRAPLQHWEECPELSC